MRQLANIWNLGVKELRSLASDKVMLIFVLYAFSFAIYSQATGVSQDLHNASIAIADEDKTQLSENIAAALMPPYFKTVVQIAIGEITERMNDGRNTFILDIPPKFEADVLAGRAPVIQVNIDATAIMQAGLGAGYIQEIVSSEVGRFYSGTDAVPQNPVEVRTRIAFNANLTSSWFMGVAALINNITELAIILAGAAVIRERERGTLDHLLVMPVSPFEIAMAKVWSNGLVITVCTGLSLAVVVRSILALPVMGSSLLFLCSVMLYLFFAIAVGLLLGTVARSMPQFGLLALFVVLPMNMLSGSNTPLESMPKGLQDVMLLVPSTQFVKISQAILFRGAGFDMIWANLLIVGVVGSLLLALALMRFRASVAQTVG